MNILIILIPVSLTLGGMALAAFLWTLRSDQYSDMEGDAMRILDEHENAPAPDKED